MAQPPGNGTFAVPLETNNGPNTSIDARICLTRSYEASSF